jgi:hypothetical protein
LIRSPGPDVSWCFLAEGAHGIDRLAPAFLVLLAQRQFFPGAGFEGAFDDLCAGRRIARGGALPSDNAHYRTAKNCRPTVME